MEKQEAVGATGGGGGLHVTAPNTLEGPAAGLHLSESSLHSGELSPCSVSSSTDERPRGILKNTSTIMVQRVPIGEKKKSQHWDEMNILATYHPLGKDYGLMKVDEPSTPYRRLEDSEEDLRAGTSQAVSPEVLAERLASLDSFYPKVLQFGDNNTGSKDKLTSKKMQNDFERHRKAHYDEGKFLKAQKLAVQDDEEEPPGTALPQKRSGSPVMSGWCHWLITKELSWKSSGIPDRDAGESQRASGGPERRHETLRLHWSQEEDAVQWKM
ncbi:protein phosphatase inhibitor 2-like isoform X2 [Monodelphis domestica]|uniref:protein phosphatase inhibitor 2-like isoform X2 n=1 Tax=Monodelphis domestica TaxID=13616 RepID=UPI00044336E6|nr:protein phosphatase inhibitor 2-like isoform X2 [Monodelphis domestica]